MAFTSFGENGEIIWGIVKIFFFSQEAVNIFEDMYILDQRGIGNHIFFFFNQYMFYSLCSSLTYFKSCS